MPVKALASWSFATDACTLESTDPDWFVATCTWDSS